LNATHDFFAVNERCLCVNNARSTENPRGFFVNRELLIVSHVFFTVNPARSSLVVAFTTVMIWIQEQEAPTERQERSIQRQ
jgi:hypothetical protein